MRLDGRKPDELRPITIVPHFSRYPEGSALITSGNTQVLCNATVEGGLPRWMQENEIISGWVTAEYDPFSHYKLEELLVLADKGILELFQIQNNIMSQLA